MTLVEMTESEAFREGFNAAIAGITPDVSLVIADTPVGTAWLLGYSCGQKITQTLNEIDEKLHDLFY